MAGLVGGLAFLVVVTMGLAVGMTRMNLLYVLGSMLAPKAPRSTVYAVGLGVHAMASSAFGLVHAGVLHATGAMTPVGSLAAHVAFGLVTGALYAAIGAVRALTRTPSSRPA